MSYKHIVLVQNINFPQQWAVDIFYYAKYLSLNNRYKVTVLIHTNKSKLLSSSLEIIQIQKKNLQFIIEAFITIRDINKTVPIDYVYFFAQHPLSVLLQAAVKYFLKIKTIYDVVSWPIGKWLIPTLSKYTIKLWVALSNKYVVLDKGLIHLLNLPLEKEYTIVPMWYDPEVFKPIKGINLLEKKEWELIFLYVWTLNTERNLHIFLNAFMKVSKENLFLRLYFIWSWNWEKYLRNIAHEQIWKTVFFLWLKPHNTIPQYLNSADCLISYIPIVDYFQHQPPTKLVEYLACGKRCIVTDTKAQRILVWDTMKLYWDSCDSMIKAINDSIKLIKNEEDIIQQSYRIKKCSWPILIQQLVTFIDSDL